MKFLKKLGLTRVMYFLVPGIKSLQTQITQNKSQITQLKKQKPKTPTPQKKYMKPASKLTTSKPKNPIIELTKTKTRETQALQILKDPTSTTQLSKKLKITRSYASKILNQLEAQNKAYKHTISGKTILYKKH